MGYTLILAEKPSAALRIAESLAEGKVKEVRRNGASYYEITRKKKDIFVVPAVGHLFLLGDDSGSNHWTYPVFSVKWRPTYRDRNNTWSKKYYKNIEHLKKGAGQFVSATDYDVEGSVIAYNIFRFIFNVKNGRRMKFSTLTKPDLVQAYEHASQSLDFPQIEAGLARHRLDWYFGINLTRAITLSLEHAGGYWTLSTGRVQGPVLKILRDRDREIREFKPVPYWIIELTGSVKNKKIKAFHSGREFWDRQKALDVLESCKGLREGIIESVVKKRSLLDPPVPFDLTTLQREAYTLFGYSPKQTLDIAQSLYEQAAISYPRTSSQKLPAKIGYRAILLMLSEQPEYSGLAGRLLSSKTLRPKEGSKTDPAHPSIFPTGVRPKKLNSMQKKVYDLIVKRFLSVFCGPAEREMTRAVISVGGEKFEAHGIITLKGNWIEFYSPYARFKEEALPDIRKGDKVSVAEIEMIDKETQPPSHYTQASILKEMERLNLGTKATRAHILQTLYDRGYIKEKSIIVTELGEAVVSSLEKYCPEIISPELTRKFEEDMELIMSNRKKRGEIVKEAEAQLAVILERFRRNERNIGLEIYAAIKIFEKTQYTIGRCRCGGELKVIHSRRTKKRFIGCSNYPKCTTSYPLPQAGKMEVHTKTCSKCGLFMVTIKQQDRRPWNYCIRCSYESRQKEKPATGRAKASKAGRSIQQAE